ncbi:hypothetical protein EWF20_10295 [Sulfolobus sp. S-194]|uniref:hypothetical protein n=1 Tax=Sulfolobus sp. S-194 TaxID=2512240 RepID=UPI001436DD5F|nr:hypothetical protein [Sulfolobus sp. S-194]QIW24499.1 hypothetical protein EWF20_10295 [Sulfolobus sp. S-194]
MKVFRVKLRAYNGFNKEILPSTTVAGGITYGAYLNKHELHTNVGFTNFYKSNNSYKLYLSRIKLNRTVNESEPFYSFKYVNKGEYYLIYTGYAIADKEDDVIDLIKKYGTYIGNWNTVFVLDSISEINNINDLCVYNLPITDLSELLLKYKEIKVEVHRYVNSNYINLTPYKIYYDPKERKFKITRDRNVYLATFKVSDMNIGHYYDESALDNLSIFDKIYVKMGFGVVGPCL